MNSERILILGVGNLLFTDEGFGIRVIEKLQARFEFADNVSVVDGGVLGLALLGVISEADRLIVVDAIRNQDKPGTLYRLEGKEIPERIRAKNSLHQVDLLETLTLCQVLDKVPQTVILGAEPENIETLGIELTPTLQTKVDPMIDWVLAELDQLKISYRKRNRHVSCDPLQNCEHPK